MLEVGDALAKENDTEHQQQDCHRRHIVLHQPDPKPFQRPLHSRMAAMMGTGLIAIPSASGRIFPMTEPIVVSEDKQ